MSMAYNDKIHGTLKCMSILVIWIILALQQYKNIMTYYDMHHILTWVEIKYRSIPKSNIRVNLL